MGSGDDKVFLGSGEESDPILFFAATEFDGGTGTNTIDVTAAVKFNAGAPDIDNFV